MDVAVDAGTVAALMDRATLGSRPAADQLMQMFYPELKRLAAFHMRRERPGHTWQPTALVNELYLELVKIRALRPLSAANDPGKVQFFNLAGHLMKRLLIHHARPAGWRLEKTELSQDEGEVSSSAHELAEVETLLEQLARLDDQLRTVVELKIFHGCSMDEIAAFLGCAPRTAARHWTFARTWLAQKLAPER